MPTADELEKKRIARIKRRRKLQRLTGDTKEPRGPTQEAAVAESTKQESAISALEKQGFRFSNWIPGNPDAEGDPQDERQTAVMVKRGATRFGKEYREVDSEGNVN
jgi:hypothetical protein